MNRYKCEKCNGSGKIMVKITRITPIEIQVSGQIKKIPGIPEDVFIDKICDKCNGFGKLDWVEQVLGKMQDITGCSIIMHPYPPLINTDMVSVRPSDN